jgi:Bacterial Ig-like domain (group 2)
MILHRRASVLLSCLALPILLSLAGCSALKSIAITPAAGVVVLNAVGQTAQFTALGTSQMGTGQPTSSTISVNWSVSNPGVATISSTGLATAVGAGHTLIIAESGGITANSDLTVNVPAGTTGTSGSGRISSITIIPNSQALSASGQTSQLIALGTLETSGLQTDVTKSTAVKWSSSVGTIASVSASGLITGLSAGNTAITAVLTNSDGSVVAGTASVAVSLTAAPEPLLSLTIIPSSVTVGDLQDTAQFLAIGTYATPPYVRDLTNSPNLTWISAFPSVFPVNSNTGGNAGATAGIVTAYGNGTATIIAEATNPLDGTIQTATATFNCPLVLPNPPTTAGTCYPGSQAPALLATLTVYNEGLNTTNWQVTASSATGTPNVLHCGPGWTLNGGTGGSVCTATYPVGATVTLKATGGAFAGWSSNCGFQGNVTAAGPNSCTVQLTTNDTVGAIFN